MAPQPLRPNRCRRFGRRRRIPALAARLALAAVLVALPGPTALAPGLPPAPVVRRRPLAALTPRPTPDASLPPALAPLRPWLPQLMAAARSTGIPGPLLAALALVESGGNPAARSSAGAVGLLQITPIAARQVDMPIDTVPEQITAGAAYLAYVARVEGATSACLQQGPGGDAACRGRTDEALSAFYAGPGHPLHRRYVAAVRRAWSQTAPEKDAA